MLRYVLLYYIVGIIVWFSYVFMINAIRSSKTMVKKYSSKIKTLNTFFLFTSIILTLIILLLALNYVGFLPYGPDTNGYTHVYTRLLTEGHWRGRGYYSAYHTSAVFLSITTMIIGSIQLSYAILLACFILFLGVAMSIAIRSILRSIYGLDLCYGVILLILFILFLSSPQLGGFDLLQQFVSSVYGITSISLLVSKLSNESKVRSVFASYMILMAISIVTHLTSILLTLILLTAYLISMGIKRDRRSRLLLVAIIYSIVVGFAYTMYSAYVEAHNIVNSLYNVFKSLSEGAIKPITVRAYEEIPRTRVSLFAWTLLPSITTAYLIAYIVCSVKRFRIEECSISARDKFLLFSSILAMTCLCSSIISRLTPAEIARYFWQPSSMAMLMIATIVLCRSLVKVMYNTKSTLILFLLLLLLAPYLYTSLNDPGRMPAMGELRLAPVTYLDRVEMLPLAVYGIEGYHVYAWHDVRIPVEWTSKAIKFRGGGSYYPIHDILLRVARDMRVEIPSDSYLILRKEAIKTCRFENYNIVLNSIEHLVLTPSWFTS